MAHNKAVDLSGIEKRGGYTGGGSAATARPPARVPSGAHRPSSNGSNQGSQGTNGSKKN